ncbi:hypothetical protein Tco_0980046 [Tanacetum coccineum]
MDKIRRNKQKEVHTRLDFGESSKKSQRKAQDAGSLKKQCTVIEGRAHLSDLAILIRQAQLSPGQKWQTIGIILIVEITLEAETAPAASKNHMVIPALLPDIDITLVTGTAPIA